MEYASSDQHPKDITCLLDTIVSNPISMRVLKDYRPQRYIIMLFETSIICDALTSVLVDVRSIFEKFCKKEVEFEII